MEILKRKFSYRSYRQSLQYNVTLCCRVIDVKADPMNVALPTSLIAEVEGGQLGFTVYVQLADGFLSKQNLEQALTVTFYQFNCWLTCMTYACLSP